MDYKPLMGYGKKKTKKETKKVKQTRSLTEKLENRFGPLNEDSDGSEAEYDKIQAKLSQLKDSQLKEGPAGEYAKEYKRVKHTYAQFWDAVQDFEDLLNKKGLKRHARDLDKNWRVGSEKFYKFFFKMVNKLL